MEARAEARGGHIAAWCACRVRLGWLDEGKQATERTLREAVLGTPARARPCMPHTPPHVGPPLLGPLPGPRAGVRQGTSHLRRSENMSMAFCTCPALANTFAASWYLRGRCMRALHEEGHEGAA